MLFALLLAAALQGDYVVTAGPGARTLRVEARFSSDPGVLEIEDGCGRFASAVEVDTGHGFAKADHRSDVVFAECPAGGCRLRYAFDLAQAAATLRNRNVAFEHRGALLAPPSSFLFRPARPPQGAFHLTVETPNDISFVTGLHTAADGWSAGWGDLPEAPWSGFGPFRRQAVDVAGGTLDLAVAPGEAPDAALLKRWAERAGAAVASVHGRLPVARVQVILLPGGRRGGVGFGTTLGNGGASILVWMGRVDAAALDRDWVLVHELMHTALPNQSREHLWLEEGLATYLEEVGRARAGFIGEQEAWSSFVKGMPNGLPAPGDHGLDRTHTWGRTYWGGALFALAAEIEIRERTHGAHGLEDALQAIVRAGGTIETRWPIARVLEVGDAATGTRVLQDLYARWSTQAVDVDLDALFARVGVRRRGDVAELLDGQGAETRRGITGKVNGAAPRRDAARGGDGR